MFTCCSCSDEQPVELAEVPKVSSYEKEPCEEGEEGLRCTFLLPDCSTKEVLFKAKPLGLDFRRSTPLTVRGVRPPRGQLPEVQVGWILTHLQGEELSVDLKAATLQLLLAVKKLPMR
ncbi:unnamed protein product [Durusdinium trenchii]|uniref:Uncharacterized protein n=2 Tax=Durusdinium trenchii TaxID=1381693 RepID=A0ABP0IAB9_9DINO